MAKPRGDDDNPVSLFPFLSILACVIGTLILLICSLAITQMESGPEEELVQRVEEYREIEQEQKEIDESLKTVLPKVHELEQYKEALAKLEKMVAELRKKKDVELRDKTKDKLELKKLLEQEKKLLELIAALEKKKKSLEEQLAKLREELQRRKMVVNAPTVCVMPTKGGLGSKGKARPVFVEADAKGLILDPNGKKQRVPRSKVTTDPGFKKIIDGVAKNKNQVLVLLIRDDGISSYSIADRHARTHNAMVAKLPLIGKGELDLSRF